MAGNGGNLIVSAGTLADSPGLCQGSRVHWAVNIGKYVWISYKALSATTIYARISADAVTWSDPTTPTKTITNTNNAQGKQLGVAYANLGSTDVFHFTMYSSGTTSFQDHNRATISGTTMTWGTSVQTNTQTNVVGTGFGQACAVASDGRPFDSQTAAGGNSGDYSVARATNADTGSSWTTGFAAATLLFSSINSAESQCLMPLSSGGKMLSLGDNGFVSGTPNQILFSLYGGSSWSPATATAVFATTASININDWGACLVNDTDVHAARRNDSTSTFTHRRWGGSNWAAGQSIPNTTCKGSAGIPMVSDGTDVWLFCIDSAAGNAIKYIKWTAGGSPAWDGAWTTFESSSQVRTFLTAVYNSVNNEICVSWTQTNSTNFDVMAEILSLGTTPFVWEQLTDPMASFPVEYLRATEIVGY